MNISKDGKTLFFSDDEIDKSIDGEKRVFVTKRINGEETHNKIEKKQKKFDFDNEIVIGVNSRKITNKKNATQKKQSKINKKNKQLNEVNKNSKNKHQKRKKTSKKFVKASAIFLIIGIIAVFAFTAPIFNIKNIEVKGNNHISTDKIISMSGLKKGENIFKFNNSVINNIKENQYIEEASIKRKIPGTIQIIVKERTVKYQIKLVNSYAYLDKNGYILETSSVKSDVPIIIGFNITENELLNKKRLDILDLEKLNKISKIIDASKPTEIDKIITEINIENENNFCIYIESQNKKVYIGDTNDLTKKMLYIKKIIEGEKENIGTIYVDGDISNGFKPYFRPE